MVVILLLLIYGTKRCLNQNFYNLKFGTDGPKKRDYNTYCFMIASLYIEPIEQYVNRSQILTDFTFSISVAIVEGNRVLTIVLK